jgi:hypothetical protein
MTTQTLISRHRNFTGNSSGSIAVINFVKSARSDSTASQQQQQQQ